MKLSQQQYRELAKYLLDISKLIFASLILKLFEPNAPEFSFFSLASVLVGLTATLMFAILGLRVIKEVRVNVH